MPEREDLIVVKTEMDDIKRDIIELKEEVKNLTAALNRYKGFFGGIMLMASAVVTCFSLLSHYLRVKS